MKRNRFLLLVSLVLILSFLLSFPVNAALRSPPYVYNEVVIDTRYLEEPVGALGYITQSTNSQAIFSFTDTAGLVQYVYRIQVTASDSLIGADAVIKSYNSSTDTIINEAEWSRYDARLVMYCSTASSSPSSYVQIPLYNYDLGLWNIETMPASSVSGGYAFTFICTDYFYTLANSTESNSNNGYWVNRFAWNNDYRTHHIPDESLDGYAQGFAAGYTEGYANGYKGGVNASTGQVETTSGYWIFKEQLLADNYARTVFLEMIQDYIVENDDVGTTYRIPAEFDLVAADGNMIHFDGFEVWAMQETFGTIMYYYQDAGPSFEVYSYTGDGVQSWRGDYRVLYFNEAPSEFVFYFLNNKAYYVGPVYIYDAYQAGYLAGVDSNTSNEFIRDILGETLEAPVRGLDGIILYQSGGVTITLWNVLGTAIVLMLFIAFLKMFAGG